MLTNTEEGKLTQQEVESFLKVTNAFEDIKATKTEGSRANMGGEAGRKREEGERGGLREFIQVERKRGKQLPTPLSYACGMILYASKQCLRQSG